MNASKFEEMFCAGHPIWDYDLMWNTTYPEITPCFQKTVLYSVPSAVLILLSPFEIYTLYSSNNGRNPWNWLNISKIIICCVLVGLNAIKLACNIQKSFIFDGPLMNYLSPVVLLFTFVIVLLYTVLECIRGIHTSGVQWVFWFTSVIVGIFIYYNLILMTVNKRVTFNAEVVADILSYPMIVIQFVLNCLGDKRASKVISTTSSNNDDDCDVNSNEANNDSQHNVSAELNASFISSMLYIWFDRFIYKGLHKDLEIKDLWALNPQFEMKNIFPKFDKYFQREARKYENRAISLDNGSINTINKRMQNGFQVTAAKKFVNNAPPSPNILKALLRAHRSQLIVGILFKCFGDLLSFSSIWIFILLIDYSKGDSTHWQGLLYSGLMFIVSVTCILALTRSCYIISQIGLQVKGELTSEIYRKALRLSNNSKMNDELGNIVNLITADLQRLENAFQYFILSVFFPIQVALVTYLMWCQLGLAVLAVAAVLIMLFAISSVTKRYIGDIHASQMKMKDERIRLMYEILRGIKVLKLNAWEPGFLNIVQEIRNKELSLLRKEGYLNTAVQLAWTTASIVIALIAFTVYALMDPKRILDAKAAYISMFCVGIIKYSLKNIPLAIQSIVQAYIGLRRLRQYFISEEISKENVQHSNNESYKVTMVNASFAWDLQKSSILNALSFRVKTGNLVAVVGEVGAGKSSLISAILGEMSKLDGDVTVSGSVAYVSQQAWLLHDTIKNNILFGKQLKTTFYNKVIEACSLIPDLNTFPAEDETEIGDRGIILSGGQKQRVSLARAVYSEADIHLLDDPLSAVDVHVGVHIFNKVIGPRGLLKDKTRILVTHNITILPQVDMVIVLKDGTIADMGTYQELLEKNGSCTETMFSYLTALDNERQSKDSEDPHKNIPAKLDCFKSEQSNDISKDDQTTGINKASLLQKGKLGENETVEVGQIKWTTYFNYVNCIRRSIVLLTLSFFVIAYACFMGSNIWLSIWTNDHLNKDETYDIKLRNLRLSVFVALGLAFVIFIFLSGFGLIYGTIKAAAEIHSKVLNNIIRLPMCFFDVTPVGRIINRLSKDMDVIDCEIPGKLQRWFDIVFQIVAAVLLICIFNPLFIMATIPISILYYLLMRGYVSTSSQLMRLESTTRSCLYSHISETISGGSTIRAFGKQNYFIDQLDKKLDVSNTCYYLRFTSVGWSLVRQKLLGIILVFCVTLIVTFNQSVLNPGLVGMTISNAFSLIGLFSFWSMVTSELENSTVAVERLKEYIFIPTEAEWTKPAIRTPINWPSSGEISFNGYCMKYRKDLDLVLKNITCVIKSGEKVGIVGRTGAGKSSLSQALFRINEADKGTIIIDGIDISSIGLHDLRSKLTMIPQDAFLFSGTMRSNVDPLQSHSDAEVWQALELSHLKSFVESLPGTLTYKVAEEGNNLSMGQKQLVCLARTLLRKNKILVLDEATAAMDLKTDDLIQTTIRKEFAACTVLTIAHRINTVMDNDRILVIDDGSILEFDSPAVLLKDQNSIFHGMAKKAGLL